MNAWQTPAPAPPETAAAETHLSNIKQLTFEGENAEAYFSFDGRRLVFQSTHGGGGCDQIYTINVDGSGLTRVSSGKGRTTCGFFYPDGQHILYASTFKGSEACPPKPDFSRGYVWPVYDTYDIYRGGRGRQRDRAVDDHARVRRRGDHREGRHHRVHERARRRHGNLLDARGWHAA